MDELRSGFIIEPQTQFVYQTVSLSDGSDSAATVQFRNVEFSSPASVHALPEPGRWTTARRRDR